MRLVAGERGTPGRAVPPFVVQRPVGAEHEHVEPVRPPRDHARIADADAAHVLVAGERGTPGRAVPPFVIQRAVGAGDEHVEPVRAPGDRLRHAGADAAHGLVAGERGTPGRAVPPFVIERAVAAQHERVEPVRAPRHHRRRTRPRTAGGRADGAPRTIEAGLHAGDLARGEHEHRGIIDIVHVVHEHVAVGSVVAGDVRERRRAGVSSRLIGRVRHVVRARTAGAVIAPDVVEVQPMADFVGRGTAEMERRAAVPTVPNAE